MSIEDQHNIQHLIYWMHKADLAYYNSKPIMTDGEFDNMYFQLKRYKQKYPQNKAIQHYFATIPKNTDNTFQHIKHPYFIGSLDKTRTRKAVSDFLDRWTQNKSSLWYTKTFLVERKEDGLSVVLYFNDPRMPKSFIALTRGGGYVGEDITNELYYFNKMNINQIRKRVGKRHLVVRGEALISDQDFQRVNHLHHNQWANARNLASGALMNKNPKVAGNRGVFLSTYTLINRDEYLDQYPTEMSQMTFLESLGFYMIKNIHQFPNTAKGKQNILNFMFNFPKSKRKAIGHPIDGMVIKPNNTKNLQKIGWNKHGPRYSVSWKFPPQSALGILNKIRWQESANGRLTPVGILKKPVHILGSNIQKASLGTVGDMKKYHIMLNGYVRVLRMNDVIPKFFGQPQLNQNRKLVDPVTTLPQGAYQNGKYFYTKQVNNSLTALTLQWSKLLSKPCLDIKGLSNQDIKKMIQKRLIDPYHFNSLFKINKSAWLNVDGFGIKSWNNLQQQIKQAKNIPLSKVLLGLPIPNAGLQVLKPVARQIHSLQNVLNHPEELQQIEYSLLQSIPQIKGLGKASQGIIKELFQPKIIQQLKELTPYLNLTEPNKEQTDNITTKQPLQNQKIVITGTLSQPRRVIKQRIQKYGGKVQNNVNSKTSYLVCNQPSHSRKYQKAQQMQVPIINEYKLKQLINQ